jgi:ABC-type uncharacterized transport system substrate-binding protein
MRRRAFITLLAGAAAAWPLAARAQQGERVRRVGVLLNTAADDPLSAPRAASFQQALRGLGWSEGRNVRIDYRYAATDRERYRRFAEELIALAPDVVVAATTSSARAFQEASRTVPIVFTAVIDPVGSGLVASLARPGGNTTGFMPFEYGISGKWLELLKQIAPRVTRAAVLRDPDLAAGIGQFAAIQSVAPSLGVELVPIDVRQVMERGIAAFARSSNDGLIVTASLAATLHRARIISLAAEQRLPAVYPFRYYVADGGLICYGPDLVGEYRQAADYVDRILKGEKPADLPVQTPTKYELVINLKTATALGLTVPPALLARADGVIE